MNLKRWVAERVREALQRAVAAGALPEVPLPEVQVERPQNPQHGDLASNVALRLARSMGMAPLEIAQRIRLHLPPMPEVQEVEVAVPGFLNFRLSPAWLRSQVDAICEAGESYGRQDLGGGLRVQVEFVSGNPTGPLHIGHGRGAVLGSTLANVLEAVGYRVTREYYINDAGAQVQAFARSLWARYLQALGRPARMPEEGYHGAYLVDLAREIARDQGERYLRMPEEEGMEALMEEGLRRMLEEIREDLERIRVRFDVWFSERSLYASSTYRKAMALLQERGFVVEREGAVWFLASTLGEERDAVLVRSTGVPTYFASDIAYHYDKFLVRGFDRVINIWGADHQGHIPRLRSAVQALGVEPERLTILTAQLVTLKKGGEAVRFSKRTGEMVTLRELVEMVGVDPVRYFFLARAPDAQMEFDLDLAVRQSQENPVYYIQYAHARIAGILRTAREAGLTDEGAEVRRLEHPREMELIRTLVRFPEVLEQVARTLEPHHLPYYALEVAERFHKFYDECRVVGEEEGLARARLRLVGAVRVVLGRCLALMEMEAPERM